MKTGELFNRCQDIPQSSPPRAPQLVLIQEGPSHPDKTIGQLFAEVSMLCYSYHSRKVPMKALIYACLSSVFLFLQKCSIQLHVLQFLGKPWCSTGFVYNDYPHRCDLSLICLFQAAMRASAKSCGRALETSPSSL